MNLDDYTEAAEERGAIMEHDGELPREQADKKSREWMMECLARQIFKDFPSLGERRGFLARWEKRHGKDMTDELKGYMASEHAKRKAA